MPADPTMLYSPGDFTATRKRIFEDSLDAVKKRFPIENTRYSLSLENVSYDNPREFTLKDQKRAVQNDQSLSWRIKGNWVLRDKNTGNVVSTSSRRAIMDIPYLTERGTFIRNGTEMTLPLQMRLVPGVYSRFGEDGLAKAHINARQGTGNTVMMTLNPAKPIFRVSVGTRNYDLFPLLKHNGVSDEEIKAAWGEQLFKANEDAFVNGGGWYRAKTAADNPDPNDPWEKASKDVLGGELDVNNTEATFGTPYDRVDPKLLLATSARLIGLAKGTASGDNRDSMENQRFFGPSDYIAERIRLDAGGLARNLLWRVSRYGDAEKIPSSPLSKYVHGLFTESNLSQAIEETNLLDAYKRATMVTRMGEGGIGSLESAPMSARLVHNTYKGFIDPVSSPECHSIAHMVYTKNGWKPIADITTDDLVACMIEGRLEYHQPEQVVSYDFDGQLYCYKNDVVAYEATGNHRLWCRKVPHGARFKKNGSFQKEYNPEYAFEYAEDVFNTNRLMMGCGHLPLTHDVISTKTLTSDEDSYTFNMHDWCEFLGWYISEGSVLHKGGYHRWVMISQVERVNKENCERIAALLARMGIKYRFDGKCFNITSRALWNELRVLGYCDQKYIPDEVFMASYEDQSAFIESLLLGDGIKDKNKRKPPVLCTTSYRLAKDYERLLFERGFASSVIRSEDNRKPQYKDSWRIRILDGKEIWLIKNGRPVYSSKNNTTYQSNYYKKSPYSGKVYCLTVPGGLFYTKIEGYHGFWTGNSLRVGLDTQIAHSARRGTDGLVYAPYINATTGKTEYLSTLEASKVPTSFPEYRNSKDFLIPAMVGNTIQYLPKSDVKYFVPNGDSLFSTACDFVPIKSGIKAGRLLMAQKHQTQAMSIKDRMAPYVQALDPDGSGKSMEEVNSHIMGAVKAGLGGKVVRVTKDDITVLQTDGKRRSYSLYDNYPLNRKSVVNNTAQVKVGDTVKPGQLLASSSYTDDKGVAALGTQLRSGWLSYKGWNYLDAIVVSESAAKKLTSEHFYHEGIDREEGTDIGKDRYVAAFPSKFNRDQLATIDANGAVKPGTLVQKGDPLVLATSLRPGGPGTGYRATHKDVSSVWEHEFPGEVTDVVDGKDGMRVYVKSWVPLQVGDKMATRFANKGTCAMIVPDEKMPKGADGRPLEILFSPTGIVSRCYDPEHRFLTKRGWVFGKDVLPEDELWIYDPKTNTCRWGKQCDAMYVNDYEGELYGFKNEQVDFLVTKGHRIWTRGEEPWSAWRERLVEDVWGKRCVIPGIANRSDDPEATRFYLPPVYGISNLKDKHEGELSFDAHDWAELLGWYLSEGNTTYDKEIRQYKVNIAQSIKAKPGNVERIRELLTRMGIKFCYSDKNLQFHISGIRFAEYFKQFGYCYEKFIPDWLFTQPVSVMKRFLEGMWAGDGNVQPVVKPSGKVSYAINIGLTSEKLIEQIQTVITMCGTMSSRQKTLIDPRDTYNYKPIYGLGVCTVDRQYRLLRNTTTDSGWYKVPYSGKVYCPSVETGYVVTMRNGKISCLGNTNSAAMIEAALGKVAEKTGKRFILPGFGNDLIALAQKELAEAGLTDREDVTDPDTGRVIKGVFTGNSYVTKFHHTSESKGGARSTGTYTADEQPASGGHDGAKTLGGLVLGAFAAHGASEVLKDMKLIKGQKNTDFWRDFKMGRTPAMPGTPLIYKKFLAALEASGVHVTHDGDKTNIFAMTNSDVSKLARSEINSAATYDDKKFLPIKGGLFDPDIFGQNGDQWAKMKLDEPILNPIMDDVVCNFLNLKKADLDAVLAGEMKLPNGLTGGEGLRKQLGAIRLDNLIENAKHTIRSGPPSRRDKAIKTLRWASAMQNNDVTPDMFMLDEVPVLPPRYRRITRSGDLNMIADANYLYKELIDARDDLRKAKEAGLPDELLGYGRKRISDAFRAVTGLADPQDRKLQESGVNGLLKWVFGKGSPKCHDDITEVLTENGWVNFKDYKNKSVKVATLNPTTMAIEYQSPTDIIHEPYKGEMIEISNKEIDMCVTYNHNVLLKDSREWSTHRAFVLLYRSNATYTFLGFDNTDLMKEVTVWYTDIKEVPYDGYVHCVTVPNGLIVTRRNGKASVGGNSGGLQRLVIGGKLDVAGRSVIDVDPRLNLDEIGMPEKQAWGLYRDFIIRKLVQGGMSPLQATKSVVDRTSLAKDALLKVLSERPVIATRAPALHKFSVQAFKPKLIPGDVLMLNSVVGKGYNSDSDGDTMTYYVPVSDKAVKEAYRLMMPSANQLSARDFTAMPEMQEELVSGAFLASHKKNTPPKKIFDTRAEAMAAYRRGEIDVDDNVVIRSEQ